jgi:hypothetical protein
VTRRLPSAPLRALFLLALATAPLARPVAAAMPPAGDCSPPRTLVALLPLADQTDRTWQLWTGESPVRVVERMLTDSLEYGLGRTVLHVPFVAAGVADTPPGQGVDDEVAVRAARESGAEIAITGTVSVFTHDDRREAGRFGRWGVSALDVRSRMQVRVTLRVLDTADGSVIIETTASREKSGRGTASAHRSAADDDPADPLASEVLSDVLADLSRTIGERLDAHWRARVILDGPGAVVLDAGARRGLFMGERLDVWRSGIEVYDENLMRVGDDARVGTVVVVALEGHGRARARLIEGEARMGDLVRPCSEEGGTAVSLRR